MRAKRVSITWKRALDDVVDRFIGQLDRRRLREIVCFIEFFLQGDVA